MRKNIQQSQNTKKYTDLGQTLTHVVKMNFCRKRARTTGHHYTKHMALSEKLYKNFFSPRNYTKRIKSIDIISYLKNTHPLHLQRQKMPFNKIQKYTKLLHSTGINKLLIPLTKINMQQGYQQVARFTGICHGMAGEFFASSSRRGV